MNTKMFAGMYNAPKDKRYKSFAVQTADDGTVWALAEAADVSAVRQKMSASGR